MKLKEIREMYPEGTQIVLTEMAGESQMPYGLKGTVKLDRYKAQSKQQKEAERKEPEVSKPEVKNAPAQTVHQQPKPKNKNVKER